MIYDWTVGYEAEPTPNRPIIADGYAMRVGSIRARFCRSTHLPLDGSFRLTTAVRVPDPQNPRGVFFKIRLRLVRSDCACRWRRGEYVVRVIACFGSDMRPRAPRFVHP